MKKLLANSPVGIKATVDFKYIGDMVSRISSELEGLNCGNTFVSDFDFFSNKVLALCRAFKFEDSCHMQRTIQEVEGVVSDYAYAFTTQAEASLLNQRSIERVAELIDNIDVY